MMLNICAAAIATLLLFIPVTVSVNKCSHIIVHWWESRPYVYNEQGNVSGVLPNIFEEAESYCCLSELNMDWSSRLASFEKAWLDLEQSIHRKTNSSTLDIWLPFSTSTPTSKNMTALKITESNQIILFVSENKWDKLESVFNGFKRIAPQVLATVLLTILFGILIWIVVSHFCLPSGVEEGAGGGRSPPNSVNCSKIRSYNKITILLYKVNFRFKKLLV